MQRPWSYAPNPSLGVFGTPKKDIFGGRQAPRNPHEGDVATALWNLELTFLLLREPSLVCRRCTNL